MAILSLLILAALVMVILTNLLAGAQVPYVSLVFWSRAGVPVGYLIALSALAGALVVWLAALPKHVHRYWTIRKLEATVAEKQRAYEALAQEAARRADGALATPPPPPAPEAAPAAPAKTTVVQGEYEPPAS